VPRDMAKSKADLDARLLAASRTPNEDASLVVNLLIAGADPAVADENGWTALHHCLARTDAYDVKMLLRPYLTKKAPLDAKTKDGRTPIMLAVDMAVEKRVDRWESEGEIKGVAASYTIEKGVMTFRKDGKVKPIRPVDERKVAGMWCPQHVEWLNAIMNVEALLTKSKLDAATKKKILALGHAKLTERVKKKKVG
jgi:hypothetical protein